MAIITIKPHICIKIISRNFSFSLSLSDRLIHYNKDMKNKNKVSKVPLARIYFIDKEIAAGKFPNNPKLAKKYECGTATISRDIEYMKSMMDAPIEYDYKRKGYYYTQKTFRLPAAIGSADEILALGMAKNLLSLYKNTPIHDTAQHFLESMTSPLGDKDSSQWYEDRVIVPAIPSAKFSSEVWKCICEAIQNNRVLSFDYRATWKSGYTPRHFYPYQLLFDNGAWYLYAAKAASAYSEEGKGTRMYSLPRIINIKIEKETFRYNVSTDFRLQIENSFLGAYSEEKKRRFKIAFYNDGAMRVRERIWTADQRIKETKEGVILSFSSNQYGKVLELVLANGRDAQPLEPAELVKDWKENLKDMMKKVKK